MGCAAKRVMRPDFVVEQKVGSHLLGELRRLADLPLAEAFVLERAVEALDHAMGLRNVAARAVELEPAADILPTDASPRSNTPEHSPARGPPGTLDRAAPLHTRHYSPSCLPQVS